MARWFLTPPQPNESALDALRRLVHDENLILGEQEQLALQQSGSGGYVAKLSGDLNAQGHRINGLPRAPITETEAVSLAFLKNGRVLYSESDRFQTDKRLGLSPAIDGTEAVTLAQLNRLLANALAFGLPSGVIVMWHGTVATIPQGWHLCDGTNNTPDLRDQFIVGAKQDNAGVANTNITGALTQTGGAVNHTPVGTVSQPTFTGNAVAAASTNATPDLVASDVTAAGVSPVTTATGTVSQPTFIGTAGQTLPPYFALCYIMKL